MNDGDIYIYKGSIYMQEKRTKSVELRLRINKKVTMQEEERICHIDGDDQSDRSSCMERFEKKQ